ncbi:hypothetical protein DFH29DRAFT_1002109 [Suillus ampliporus]|nr:hypothetical protein DFH29DRAFT_1002109 [Suillus ampliporus]
MDVGADPAVLQQGSIRVREDPAVLLHGSVWPPSVGFPSPECETLKMRKHGFEWLAIGRRKKLSYSMTRTSLPPGSPLDHDDWSCDGINDTDFSCNVTEDAVLTMDNGAVLTMDNDLPCPCDSPTLQTLETLAGLWRKEWGSENVWNEAYNEALGRTQTKGERETTIFLDQCAQHVWEGRTLLDSIRDVVHTSCPYCRERLKYDTILLYDLLVGITAEVKFFEVKLDTCCN